jgi:glycosyltransferase involved in cell wall biosynthesis
MISILMPLHNGVNFIQLSVNSVIGQTYKDWELLIGVNGLSPNRVRRVLWEMTRIKDKRITVSIFPEKGKVKTLNKLAQLAKYDHICLLDVDDYWFEQKLEKQLPLAQKYDVVGSDAEYFGEQTNSPLLFLGQLTLPMFTYQNPLINSSVMLKKADAQWCEAWEGLDDYNLWVHLLGKQKTFYNVPEILVKHRIHDKSAFNHINGDLSAKLKEEKLPKLNEQEWSDLSRIMDKKEWKL